MLNANIVEICLVNIIYIMLQRRFIKHKRIKVIRQTKLLIGCKKEKGLYRGEVVLQAGDLSSSADKYISS